MCCSGARKSTGGVGYGVGVGVGVCVGAAVGGGLSVHQPQSSDARNPASVGRMATIAGAVVESSNSTSALSPSSLLSRAHSHVPDTFAASYTPGTICSPTRHEPAPNAVHGNGAGVGVAVGVGVERGVAVGLAVEVAFGVEVGAGIAVGIAVVVGTGVRIGVSTGVGVGRGAGIPDDVAGDDSQAASASASSIRTRRVGVRRGKVSGQRDGGESSTNAPRRCPCSPRRSREGSGPFSLEGRR